jgi:hypothetical protein
LKLIFGLSHSQNGSVVLLSSLLSSFLLELSVGLHFLGDLVDDGGQIDFFAFGLLLECRELLHDLVILVPLLDQIVTVGPEQSVYFWMLAQVPSSMRANSSLEKKSLSTLQMR